MKSICKILIGIGAMLALSPLPAESQPPMTATQADDVKHIIQWADDWKSHIEAGKIEQMRAMYEPDAILMAHRALPQKGVDAILGFLGRNKSQGNQVTIDFANEEIIVEGKRAYLTAKYWMTITPKNSDSIDVKGRSFLVFKKGLDGKWRLWRDIDNFAPDVTADGRPAS